MEWLIRLVFIALGFGFGAYVQKNLLISKVEAEIKKTEAGIVDTVNLWWTKLKTKL